jgi:cell division protein FtsW
MDTRWNEFKERLFESKTSQIKTKSAPKDFEQIDYAHLAIAAGTLLPNKGPGNSQIKYILPQSFSDFIFAVVVEEYGVLVSVVLVLLMFFIVLPWRIGMYIKRSKNMFATLLMIGMGLLLTMQALAHVGVCVELLPVTGQNLPLISHGGSSMISTCIMFGLIMNVMNYISKTEYNEKYTTPESSTSEQKEDK